MRLKIAFAVLTLAVAAGGLFERQTFQAEAQQAAPELTGDVIVKFKDGTTLAGVGAALDGADADAVQSTPSGAVLVAPDDGQSVTETVDALEADPNVAYAEPDVLVTSDATPNDTYYANQAWHFNQINAPAAWDVETGVTSTVIAVVDTGVQSAHTDLSANTIAGANFVTVPIATSSAGGSGRIRINTSTAHSYLSGDSVTVAGHSAGGANGTWTVSLPAAVNISSSSVSAGTITVTTSAAHNLSVGDFVMVRGHSIGAADGEWTVTAVPSSTQFRYSCSPSCTTGSGTGGVAKQASYFDLVGSTYISGGTSGTAKNNSPRDDEGHGTFVSGLVAARGNNGAGVAGVCWTCKILPVKVLGSTGTGSSLAVAAGIEWATDNGADVINLSLSSAASTQAMQDAVDYAWANGVVVIAASGNENSSVKYPAKYPNVVAVGATTNTGVRASFSNYGPELDVVAPGENVMSTLATGFGDSTGWYGWGSGTSFAAPHVAGVVGLMISNGMTDKNDIVDSLKSTATDAGAAGFDNEYGYGIVDTAEALTGGVDTTPPTASITSPADGATVSGTVLLTASASDNVGVSRVYFYIDGAYLNYDTTSPWLRGWNTSGASNGPHTITVRSRDAAGNWSTDASVQVNVSNGDSVPPVVDLTYPTDGASVSGKVVLTATASDNAGVSRVYFYVDGAYVNYDNSAPYARGWDSAGVPDGSHTVTARALDNAGNWSTVASATVNVSNGDATAPTVSITSHSDGQTVSGKIVIAANASDNVGVTRVYFYVDGAYINYDTTSPWARGWQSSGVANGPHTLSVRALDGAGNWSTLSEVDVNVNN